MREEIEPKKGLTIMTNINKENLQGKERYPIVAYFQLKKYKVG